MQHALFYKNTKYLIIEINLIAMQNAKFSNDPNQPSTGFLLKEYFCAAQIAKQQIELLQNHIDSFLAKRQCLLQFRIVSLLIGGR